MANFRQILYAWRDNEAVKRGVELFRVLPNSALDEIARVLPRTKDELTAIKGVKEAKYREFGKVILAMVYENVPEDTRSNLKNQSPRFDLVSSASKKFGIQGDTFPSQGVTLDSPETAFSVSAYLDIVNRELYRLHARVVGEVTSIKFQGSAVYIVLKDTEDESALSVFMWARDYTLAEVEITEGVAVAVEGRSEVYKPSGRFNFRAETIELVGEGALKKAYDALKKKLESEGLFASEKKRAMPEYPEQIGLVTSKQGAVIHDFLNNLGKFGFKTRFTDARVEGAAAVKEILAAIKYFATQEVDTLVIIRGGGSLESLQAFNNERVVRAIAEFPKTTIVAIGHDKDAPLAQLVADHAPSTPTAATMLLNQSWEEGMHSVRYFSKDILNFYEKELWERKDELGVLTQSLHWDFDRISELVQGVVRQFSSLLLGIQKMLTKQLVAIENMSHEFVAHYARALKEQEKNIGLLSRSFSFYNPLRQLRLGYSILSKKGKVVRSVSELSLGAHFEARLSNGTIEAVVSKCNPLGNDS